MPDVITISDDSADEEEDDASTLDPTQEEEQLTKIGSVSSALGQLTNTGSDWKPWEKPKEEAPKPKRDYSEIIDGRFVFCHKHDKKRHKDRMNRVEGDAPGTYKFECPDDAKCFSDTPKVLTVNDKRYYGSMRDMVARRRSFKKVCWECGIGEHERSDCPNRIDPSNCQLIGSLQPARYSMDYIRNWSYRNHLLTESDVTGCVCSVCDKPGGVNCCSKTFASPPCCSKCCVRGHTQDECASNYSTNYHTRPDSFRGGRGTPPPQQPREPRTALPPPRSVVLPPPSSSILTSVRLNSNILRSMPKDPNLLQSLPPSQLGRSDSSSSWGRNGPYGGNNNNYDYRSRGGSDRGGGGGGAGGYQKWGPSGRGRPQQSYPQSYQPYQNDRRGAGRGGGGGQRRYDRY